MKNAHFPGKQLFLAALMTAVLYFAFPKLKWFVYISLMILITAMLCALSPSSQVESFSQNMDDGRTLRYGDSASLFTLKNTFLKQSDSATPVLTQSSTLTRPEDLPAGSYKQLFIFEDPSQPAGPGNANPIAYNSSVCLMASNGQYVAAADNGNAILQDNRSDGRCVFIIEGDNLTSTNDIKYGDTLYLSNKASNASGLYLTCNDDGTVVAASKSATSHLSVQDKYGQGVNVNWARLGKASQSSTYQNYDAYYAIDGKLLSFNNTNSELNPWWEIMLPKEVYLDRIIIKNRVNGGDAVSMRLSNFSIIVKDAVGIELARKVLLTDTPTDEFSWNNIYHTGRSIRIRLNDTAPQYLNMSEVQVFGMPITYSVLLNKPIMADLTTYAANNNIVASASTSRSFEDQELPLAKDDMSIAFWINIDPKNYAVVPTNFINVLLKGSGAVTDASGIKSPGIWLTPSAPNLKVVVSSVQKSIDGIDSSSIALPLGKPVHIAVTISSGVSLNSGWKLGNFKSAASASVLYVLFHPIQKRYYVLSGIDSNNYTSTFGKVNMLALDDLDAGGFQNLGPYTSDLASPNLSLFVNGRLSDTKTLVALPQYNSSPLITNADKKLSATFNEIKYTNYAMTPVQIRGLAVMKVSNLCKTIVAASADASKAIAISHSELPSYFQEITLAFWAKVSAQSSTKKVPLVIKGSLADPEFGVVLSETGTSMTIPVRTLSAPVIEGIDQPQFSFINDVWIHYALVIGNNAANFYVNGTSVASSTLNKKFDPNFTNLNIGGFVGSLQNCKVCNYAVSATELPLIMGPHPDTAANALLKTAFDKAGCTAYPYGIDLNPGAAPDLKTLLANGRADQVDSSFALIKKSADAYVQGNDHSVEAKANSAMCYGDISMMNLPAVTAGSGEGLPVTCLPTAPFTCPPQQGINDFDIRTHKNFYQYVKAANVKPAPTVPNSKDFIKISSLSDPATLAAFLSANPAIAQAIAADVNANNSSSATSSPATSSSAITAALKADPSAAAGIIASLVQNTGSSDLVKSIAASLLSSGNLDISSLIKQLPPSQLTSILQSAGISTSQASTSPTMSDIVSMMKDDTTMQNVIKALIANGSLTPKMLLSEVSDSSELRDLVSSSCAAQPIEDNSNFNNYIKKDSVPCWNCDLTT